MAVDVGPMTQFIPSNDDGDHHHHHHHHHHLIAIPAAATATATAATSNSVDEKMIISSSVVPSERSAFQKYELSKVGLTWVIPAFMLLIMSTNSSGLEAESKFIYSGPAPAPPEHDSKFPQWIIGSVISILMCGATFSFIGLLIGEMFALFGRVLEVVGFLLIILGVVGLWSSVLTRFLMWLPWLCYFLIIIAILLDQFPKLAVRIHATLLA